MDIITSNLNADDKNSWGTDPVVFNAINKEFKFTLDAAASHKNTLCSKYLTKKDNALSYDWSILAGDGAVWVNPPYGRGYIKKFMDHAAKMTEKGVTTVMLVPSTLDAQWLPISKISEIRIITGGRLNFYHPTEHKKIAGNTKGSMFVIFRPTKMPCCVRLIDRDELIQGSE